MFWRIRKKSTPEFLNPEQQYCDFVPPCHDALAALGALEEAEVRDVRETLGMVFAAPPATSTALASSG